MITTILNNMLAFINESHWLFKLVLSILLWFSPALELLFLLVGLISVEYLFGVIRVVKESSMYKLKPLLWAQTKMFCTKLMFYSVMALVVNAVQIHLIKESVELYRLVMAIPVLGETFTILTEVERKTGMKVMTSVKRILKNVFKNTDLPEDVIDDLSKKD